MHQDHVVSAGSNLEVLAFTKNSSIQALYLPDKILTIQAHPEMSSDVIREVVDYRQKSGVFDQALADECRKHLNKADDSLWFAESIMSFMLGDE